MSTTTITATDKTTDTLIEEFTKSTPRGAGFAFWGNLTGNHNIDGSVSYNEEGCTDYLFDTFEDFITFYFHRKEVIALLSHYVGSRDDAGEITWSNEPYSLELIEDEDGGDVYTKPVRTSC
jgi:hypothetical protein